MLRKYILLIALAVTFGLTGTAVYAQTVNTVQGANDYMIVQIEEHDDETPEGAPEAGRGGLQR